MQLCKSFFSTRRRKKRLRNGSIRDRNPTRSVYKCTVVIGGDVRQCIVDRIILGYCDHSPFYLEEGWGKGFTDDGVRVGLDFLPMPTDHLWSTGTLGQHWLQTADGFAIVFYIKQRESFDKLVNEFKFLLQLKEKNDVPLILVGSDHGYCFEPESGNTRQVTTEEAENFAQELGGKYFEMGAEEAVSSGDYIPFRYLARESRRLKSLHESVS